MMQVDSMKICICAAIIFILSSETIQMTQDSTSAKNTGSQSIKFSNLEKKRDYRPNKDVPSVPSFNEPRRFEKTPKYATDMKELSEEDRKCVEDALDNIEDRVVRCHIDFRNTKKLDECLSKAKETATRLSQRCHYKLKVDFNSPSKKDFDNKDEEKKEKCIGDASLDIQRRYKLCLKDNSNKDEKHTFCQESIELSQEEWSLKCGTKIRMLFVVMGCKEKSERNLTNYIRRCWSRSRGLYKKITECLDKGKTMAEGFSKDCKTTIKYEPEYPPKTQDDEKTCVTNAYKALEYNISRCWWRYLALPDSIKQCLVSGQDLASMWRIQCNKKDIEYNPSMPNIPKDPKECLEYAEYDLKMMEPACKERNSGDSDGYAKCIEYRELVRLRYEKLCKIDILLFKPVEARDIEEKVDKLISENIPKIEKAAEPELTAEEIKYLKNLSSGVRAHQIEVSAYEKESESNSSLISALLRSSSPSAYNSLLTALTPGSSSSSPTNCLPPPPPPAPASLTSAPLLLSCHEGYALGESLGRSTALLISGGNSSTASKSSTSQALECVFNAIGGDSRVFEECARRGAKRALQTWTQKLRKIQNGQEFSKVIREDEESRKEGQGKEWEQEKGREKYYEEVRKREGN